MPEKSERPIYYTDSLAISRRFEEVRADAERRKQVDALMELLPQGHNSELNADMIDDYHFKDLVREVLKAVQQQLPKTTGPVTISKGGRGDKGDKGDPGDTLSNPPAGKSKITNIYWDGDTQEIVIEYEQ